MPENRRGQKGDGVNRAGRATSRKARNRRRRQKEMTRMLITVFGALLVCVLVVVMIVRGERANSGATPAVAVTTPESAPTETAANTISPTRTPSPSPTPAPTPEPTPTPVPTPQPTPVKLKLPYYIVVDRGAQIVTVYTLDENGEYKLPVRTMICSTDKYNRKPPNGIYRMNGEKKRWLTTVATPRSYAQYATRIVSKILFHSLPYTTKRMDALDAKAYSRLGTNDSIGCIRLLCMDAKWIYDNVPKGTPVRFVSGEYDEALLEELAPPLLVSEEWDPTDPDENNPDYNADFVRPEVTPWLGVTPAPTDKWKADTYK